ncbi:MAG: prolipoprotein diacylglyceryl transferase [Myxococcales bacterium]|nr:prolipoprotein diacylglyceryl transferase [Myxococcales bacterium]
MLGFITWDWDPILIDFGKLQIRYYGVMFALTIYTGFAVWRRQALRNGESHEFAEQFLWFGVVAIVAGARLGHVFFYEYKTYLENPVEIVKFWKGGLASHGATIGLILALWLFGRKTGRTWTQLADYLAPAVAIAAGGVRIGNFFNSEIVGRTTDVPWGVQFMRYCRIEHIAAADCLPRHPSQLYEFGMGLVTFLLLTVLEKRGIRRAGSGFLAGVFCITYFGQRIVYENFKEFQDEQLRTEGFLGTLERLGDFHLTTGQWLSMPMVVVGVILLIRALRQPKDAIPEPVPTLEPLLQVAAVPAELPAVAAKGAKSKKK